MRLVVSLRAQQGRKSQRKCRIQVQDLPHEAEQVMRNEHGDPTSESHSGAAVGQTGEHSAYGSSRFRVHLDPTID